MPQSSARSSSRIYWTARWSAPATAMLRRLRSKLPITLARRNRIVTVNQQGSRYWSRLRKLPALIKLDSLLFLLPSITAIPFAATPPINPDTPSAINIAIASCRSCRSTLYLSIICDSIDKIPYFFLQQAKECSREHSRWNWQRNCQ